MRTYLVILMFLISLLGCTKSPDLIDALAGPAISPPFISSIQYTQAGVTKSLSSPFSTTQDILADVGESPCSSVQSLLTITGTFDTATAGNSIEVLGPASATSSYNSGGFTTTACLARGSTSLKFRVLSENKKSSMVTVSVNVSSGIISIAWGHPQYPSPGFRLNSSRQASLITSQGFNLENSTVESSRPQVIPSTGNTNLSLSTGYLKILEQAL